MQIQHCVVYVCFLCSLFFVFMRLCSILQTLLGDWWSLPGRPPPARRARGAPYLFRPHGELPAEHAVPPARHQAGGHVGRRRVGAELVAPAQLPAPRLRADQRDG